MLSPLVRIPCVYGRSPASLQYPRPSPDVRLTSTKGPSEIRRDYWWSLICLTGRLVTTAGSLIRELTVERQQALLFLNITAAGVRFRRIEDG